MSDFIEREAAIKRFSFAVLDCLGMEPTIRAGDIVKALESIPAADVRPVVRGKWIPDYDYTEYDYDGSTPLPEPRKFQDGWKCSLCGAYEPSTVNFCPNCGARMDHFSRDYLRNIMFAAADAIEERCQQVDKFAEEAARLFVEIQPHGDLVDRDALMDDIIGSMVFSGRKVPTEAAIVQKVLDIIGDANAIIPAEGGDVQ